MPRTRVRSSLKKQHYERQRERQKNKPKQKHGEAEGEKKEEKKEEEKRRRNNILCKLEKRWVGWVGWGNGSCQLSLRREWVGPVLRQLEAAKISETERQTDRGRERWLLLLTRLSVRTGTRAQLVKFTVRPGYNYLL